MSKRLSTLKKWLTNNKFDIFCNYFDDLLVLFAVGVGKEVTRLVVVDVLQDLSVLLRVQNPAEGLKIAFGFEQFCAQTCQKNLFAKHSPFLIKCILQCIPLNMRIH